ncbi:MAG: N-acetyltransferase [Candidatus Sumerlaeaceae bacterium]|nr:N-acetyltransferase [Candidatus Sumerlaeaceae bacterium]
MTTATQLTVRKAVINDVPRLQKMINGFADKNEMLHRSMNELYENIRDFVVVEEDGELLGVGAIHVTWDDLAELKCVAVAAEAQGRGLGKMIVTRCLEDARELGLRRVFALTYKPEFFEKYGFKVVDRSTLPHKVWGECIKCLKYPNCNEIAMICPVTPNAAGNGHLGPQAQP